MVVAVPTEPVEETPVTLTVVSAGGAVNSQPEFPLTLVEFAPAYHVAPPVAALSFRLR